MDENYLQDMADSFTELAEKGDEAFDSIKGNADEVTKAAAKYIKLNNAVQDLSDNYDKYATLLSAVKK